jgi:YegS/Rv2252/BmrU family lipid kinase
VYAFIINAAAGGGRAAKVRPTIERFMTAADAAFRIHETRTPEEATTLARDAAGEGDVVVAVGGDGSIHHAFSGIVDAIDSGAAAPTFGILPVGTGNDLARMLGLPDRMEDALAILTRGGAREIDYGTVAWEGASGAGVRPFINVAGIGLDAKAALLAPKLKPYLGNLCYTVSPAISVWTWNSPEATIETIDGEGSVFRWKGKFLLASVANGKWVGGGITISPQALLDDRHLDLCLVRATGPLRALVILPKAVKGRHTGLPEVEARPFQEMSVAVSLPSPIHLDGEPCTEDATHARFTVSSGQIRILVPAQTSGKETI